MNLDLCAPARSGRGYLCKNIIASNIELWLEGIKDVLKLVFNSAGIKNSQLDASHVAQRSLSSSKWMLFYFASYLNTNSTLSKLFFFFFPSPSVYKGERLKGRVMTERLLIYLEATTPGKMSAPRGNFQEAPAFGGWMSGFTRSWTFWAQRGWKLSPGYLCPNLKTMSCSVTTRTEILTSEPVTVSEMQFQFCFLLCSRE